MMIIARTHHETYDYQGCKSLIFADGYESSTIVAGVRGINRNLMR